MTLWASSLLIAQAFFFQQEENDCVQGEITLTAPERAVPPWCQGRSETHAQHMWSLARTEDGGMAKCVQRHFFKEATYSVACKGKEDMRKKMNFRHLPIEENKVHFAGPRSLSAWVKVEGFAPKCKGPIQLRTWRRGSLQLRIGLMARGKVSKRFGNWSPCSIPKKLFPLQGWTPPDADTPPLALGLGKAEGCIP